MTKSVPGPNGVDEYACGVCNKHFTMLKYLKLHLPAHTDRYRCKVFPQYLCASNFTEMFTQYNIHFLKNICVSIFNCIYTYIRYVLLRLCLHLTRNEFNL